MRWLAVGLLFASGCALAHERPQDAHVARDAGIDAPIADAFVPRVDAFVAPVDAFVTPTDAFAAPDAWPMPRCPTEQIVTAGPGRSFFFLTRADLDADGRPEIVAVAAGIDDGMDASLHVLRLVDGEMADVWHTPATPEYGMPFGVAAGDLDGDGDVDIVASLGGTRVFENADGHGRLVDRGVISHQCPSHDLEIGDLDGDGDGDLVGGSCGADGPAAYALMQDHGTFVEEPIGGHTGSVYARMLRHEGASAQRVVTAETYSATFATWERSAMGWRQLEWLDTSERIFGIVDDDLDGDGYDDFVLLRGYRGHGPQFFRQHQDGTFEALFEANGDIAPCNTGAATDFDDDGDVDVVFGAFGRENLWLYESHGDFTFDEHVGLCALHSEFTSVNSIAAGRFTDSGAVDLAVLVGHDLHFVRDAGATMFGL